MAKITKAAALAAFNSARESGDVAAIMAAADVLASCSIAPARKAKEASAPDVPAWWRVDKFGRKAAFEAMRVRFADGETIGCTAATDDGKPLNVGRAVRNAVGLYRSRIGFRAGISAPAYGGDVPALVLVEHVETGELFSADDCTRLSADWRVARPADHVEPIEETIARLQGRRERVTAEHARRCEARRRMVTFRAAHPGAIVATDSEFVASIAAAVEELARLDRDLAALAAPEVMASDAGPGRDDESTIEATEAAGDADLARFASKEPAVTVDTGAATVDSSTPVAEPRPPVVATLPVPREPGRNAPVVYYGTKGAPGLKGWTARGWRIGRITGTDGRGTTIDIDIGDDARSVFNARDAARTAAEILIADPFRFPDGARLRQRREPGQKEGGWVPEQRVIMPSIGDRLRMLQSRALPRSRAEFRYVSTIMRTLRRDMVALGMHLHGLKIVATGSRSGSTPCMEISDGETQVEASAGWASRCRLSTLKHLARMRRDAARADLLPSDFANVLALARRCYTNVGKGDGIPFPDAGRPYIIKPRIRVKCWTRPHAGDVVAIGRAPLSELLNKPVVVAPPAVMTSAPPAAASFSDWLAERLGTRRWVVAARLTQRLRRAGYTVALSPKRYAALTAEFASAAPPVVVPVPIATRMRFRAPLVAGGTVIAFRRAAA